jgi:hypothetical protein
MDIAEFFKNFLPGFAATVLGIPVGLWANSLVVAQAEEAKRKEEATRLYDSLATINEALTFNILQSGIMLQEHMNGKAFFYVQLDSSTWDVVKKDIIQYLDDPALRRRIANHFSRIEEIRRIESIYLDSVVGVMSALYELPPLKQTLSGELPRIIDQVAKEAQMLKQHIDSVQAKILSKYRLPKNLGKK